MVWTLRIYPLHLFQCNGCYLLIFSSLDIFFFPLLVIKIALCFIFGRIIIFTVFVNFAGWLYIMLGYHFINLFPKLSLMSMFISHKINYIVLGTKSLQDVLNFLGQFWSSYCIMSLAPGNCLGMCQYTDLAKYFRWWKQDLPCISCFSAAAKL